MHPALRLGCVAVGYTIYPGTAERRLQYEQLRELAEEAKAAGLAVVVWAYPRSGGLSKDGETALDVTAYAAHIAAQLGAHIIKVKLPTAHLELEEARKVYEEQHIPRDTLAERVRHVLQSTFNGRRIVIFSVAPRRMMRPSLMKFAQSALAAGSARSLAATRFNATGRRL